MLCDSQKLQSQSCCAKSCKLLFSLSNFRLNFYYFLVDLKMLILLFTQFRAFITDKNWNCLLVFAIKHLIKIELNNFDLKILRSSFNEELSLRLRSCKLVKRHSFISFHSCRINKTNRWRMMTMNSFKNSKQTNHFKKKKKKKKKKTPQLYQPTQTSFL